MTLVPVYYTFVLKVSLLVASVLGFACQVVRGFTSFAPCLEHVCAGGGGSVANEGLVLCIGGDYCLHLKC